ncbi:transglycosylase SLT domain-containing protein [Methylomonas rhizoryzae]|uniref:transglycosylase SLT domain-containing protein n=1 Tax=Methylomonas rhizoryzae TaxID=2608981 RepID=UPI0012320CAC|nr:transglycosylase SLT domain-containing protein [Methylomonas rhizoryzae]
MASIHRWFIVLGLSVLAGFAEADEPTEIKLTVAEARARAVRFEHGREGVKQDHLQAFEYYCHAALQDDGESAYALGFMYFNGRGVKRDLGLAVTWFRKAAAQGDPMAGKMLARFADVADVADENCKPKLAEVTIVADQAINANRQIVETWVKQIAPAYGIDPELIMAVIRAESGFNTSALSNKNAQGLMQLIPATAERFGVKNVWDPVQNIQGGVAYLHWLLRHFEGNVEWVLAAYNAGERAVERHRGIPPYQETQNYVRRILGWYPKARHPVPMEQPGKIVVRQKSS